MKHFLSRLPSNAASRLRSWRGTSRALNSLSRDSFIPGSWQWLVLTEIQYGGLVKNVRRRAVSPHDPRTSEEISRGGMQGGDRMFLHGYGPSYSRYFSPLSRSQIQVVLEVGILKGTGLAIWSDLFPNATIIGADIDTSHCEENIDVLVRAGAFAGGKRLPRLITFDQLNPSTGALINAAAGQAIDVVIDDGLHTPDAIQQTYTCLKPLLAHDFLYFIEDNADTAQFIHTSDPAVGVYTAGELTVLYRTGISQHCAKT